MRRGSCRALQCTAWRMDPLQNDSVCDRIGKNKELVPMPRKKIQDVVESARDALTAAEIETKKAGRAAARKAKETVEKTAAKTKAKQEKAAANAREVKNAAVAKVADNATAAAIGTQKKARSTARKAKAAVTETVEKVVGDAKDAAEKAKLTAQIEAGKAKAKRTRKAAEAKDAAKAVVEKAKTPARKARAAKLNIRIQSPMGGDITPEEIAAKIPADAESVFVRVDQNKLWWVKKDGETGSVDIW